MSENAVKHIEDAIRHAVKAVNLIAETIECPAQQSALEHISAVVVELSNAKTALTGKSHDVSTT